MSFKIFVSSAIAAAGARRMARATTQVVAATLAGVQKGLTSSARVLDFPDDINFPTLNLPPHETLVKRRRPPIAAATINRPQTWEPEERLAYGKGYGKAC